MRAISQLVFSNHHLEARCEFVDHSGSGRQLFFFFIALLTDIIWAGVHGFFKIFTDVTVADPTVDAGKVAVAVGHYDTQIN